MSSTAVVILNWNGKNHLATFLPSVVAYTPPHVASIIVIDNASTDDSILFLKQNYPQIIIVENSSNGGFAQGYNDGLKNLNFDYFLLLNSDVEVTENWLTPLIFELDNNSETAACQPKILAYQNKHFFEHAGAAGGYIDKFGYPFCRGRIFNELEKDEAQYDQNTEIFWATGACILIRAKLFFEANGFDQHFFAHMEEIDLCWRLKNKGYRIHYVYNSTVYHLGGGTLSVISPNKTYLNFRNNLFLLFKNLPSRFLIKTIFMRMVLDGVAFFHFMASFKIKHAQAILKAHFHFYKNIPRLIKQRKTLSLSIKNDYLSGVYLKSIVFDFYINKIKKFTLLHQENISK